MKRDGAAPSDENAATAWKKIMEIAEKHALIFKYTEARPRWQC